MEDRTMRATGKMRVAGGRCSAGMTLIELLVVMGIMAIIVSSIVVAAFGLQARAQRKGTEGLMDQLETGLQLYQNQYRMYPIIDEPPSVLTLENARDLSMVLWMALEHDNEFVKVRSEYKNRGGPMTDPASGAQVDWYYYRDAWENALVYECLSTRSRYSITSAGPDGEFESGDEIVRP